ncbi:hypothetical protein CWB96_19810 [Pseudoalteromonas citrea]|uniref:DUF4410 domain-containing protein n=1 Tax=Pseudoalteromonas citrea TaxID=43655 RepID=A0A5S3XL57_9GAMM|nr:DUF4410 domain-containing protein [Pseudoalteromonas citrea]TMP40803.1 hypothetical protein CWB97_16955 [Pseudoalteromonas citrea]TMP54118.1 hypothetical protein CWB96_19810 [Pseudoalteromonas citrea]
MKKNLAIVLFSLILSACSSSTKISQAINTNGAKAQSYSNIEISNSNTDAPDHFAQAVKSYLKLELKNKALFTEESGNKVSVNISDYRMRSGFTRALFGVFAGKDGVDSEVVVTDVNGKVIGKSKVSSFNVMAIGDMQDIARMHAEEIAEFLDNQARNKG